MMFRFFAAGCLGVVGFVFTHADVVPWLYEVTLPVNSQQTSEVNRVSRAGLTTVLKRITGSREVSSIRSLSSARQNAQRYLLQHSFSAAAPKGESNQPIQLATVEFDPTAIHELVRSAGLPLWPANRPKVAVWLTSALEPYFHAKKGPFSSDLEVVRAMEETASERGLEMIWAHDHVPEERFFLEDFSLAPALDFAAIAQQYDAEIVLSIDISNFEQTVWIRAAIPHGTPRNPAWSAIFDTEREGVQAAFHTLADTLFEIYGVASVGQNQLVVVVNNVETIEAYIAVLEYLKKWEFVDRVDLTRVHGPTFQFLVHSSSSKSQFLFHIQEDQMLEVQVSDADNPDAIFLMYGAE